MTGGRRAAAQRAEEKIMSQRPLQPKQRRDRRAVYAALLRFVDSHKCTWPVAAGQAEYKEAVQTHVVPLGLKRTLQSGSQVPQDVSSIMQAIADLVGFAENSEDQSTRSLFDKGSSIFGQEFLQKVGYFPESATDIVVNPDVDAAERPVTALRGQSSTLGSAGENEQSESSGTTLHIDPHMWTGVRKSPQNDSPEYPSPVSHLRDQAEHAPSKVVRVESPSRKSLYKPSADAVWPRTEDLARSDHCHRTATPRAGRQYAAARKPALRSLETTFETPLPFLGTFAVSSKDIEGRLGQILRRIESSIQSEFDAASIPLSHPADFELYPTFELQKVYETMFGTKKWKQRVRALQTNRTPRAFDALLSLVAAAVYLWVFDTIQPWQEPLREHFGTDLHRKHVAGTVKRHTGMELDVLLHLAAQSEVQDPNYHEIEILPSARQHATDLGMVLAPHIGRLCTNASPFAPPAFGESWSGCLVDIFSQTLSLAARLRVATERYVFRWYASGEDFRSGEMAGRYFAGREERVCLTLFPSVELFSRGTGNTMVSKAVVIAGETGKVSRCERSVLGNGC